MFDKLASCRRQIERASQQVSSSVPSPSGSVQGEGQGEGLATQQPFSSSSRACANENNKEMNSRSLLLTPHPGPLPLGEGQKLFGRNFPSGMLFSKLNSRRHVATPKGNLFNEAGSNFQK